MGKEEIIRNLPRLSTTELTEIKNRITALLSLGGSSSNGHADTTPARNEILEVIDSVSISLGLGIGTVALRRNLDDRMRDGLHKFDDFLKRNAPDKTTRMALARTGVIMLIKAMGEWNVPTTPAAIVRNLDKIPGLLDASFPGYAATGMLRWVVQKQESRHA